MVDKMVENNAVGRAKILILIIKKVMEVENAWLISRPTKAEIKEVIRNFPSRKSSQKSPGVDGVTYEMLKEIWPFIKQGCIATMATFWGDNKISKKMAYSIIKLIPKGFLLTILGN